MKAARHATPAPWPRKARRSVARPRRRITGREAVPLLLAVIPSLPRPVLTRLATRLIDRIDEIDGDPDREVDEEDVEHDGREPEYPTC